MQVSLVALDLLWVSSCAGRVIHSSLSHQQLSCLAQSNIADILIGICLNHSSRLLAGAM